MITIKQLRVQKEGRTICAIPDLFVRTGERVAIRGANGSGKSTLLRLLAGLEDDYRGECSLDAAWRERVYVQQDPLLFRGTVASNLLYGLKARGVSQPECEQRKQHWLDRLALSDLANRPVSGLSGGEKKRVAIARGLNVQPRLALLDEPFADLDETAVAAVATVLEEMSECTILIASPTQLPVGCTTREIHLESQARS